MKTKLISLALFATTAIGIAVFPSIQQAQAIATTNTLIAPAQDYRIEVVFVLDTTSSMSGLIQAAKEKIWSIATTMASAQQSPDISMGLVAFRDRGDAYVTRIFDLSQDLDSMYASLMDLKARGGGDGPESVNKAMFDAINHIAWSKDNSVYKVVFLVGDAPPHMDYANDVSYATTLKMAHDKGIVVNTIQSGRDQATARYWQDIARIGTGVYFQVEDSGNAVAIATPFDKKLSELATRLEDTRLYYGNEEEKAAQKSKLDAGSKLHRELSEAALARRAIFNATNSGESNFLGEGELVDAIVSGRVELDDIDRDHLPSSLQAMAPKEALTLISEKAKRRDSLKKEIASVSESRSRYIRQEIDALGGVAGSLDEMIFGVIKDQARAKGLIYKNESASY